MLSLAEQPDTFYLRIQRAEEQDALRKKEILVRWSISSDRGLTWQYVRHEFYERPTLVADWSLSEKYQVPMTEGLKALIESILEWEFWDEFRAQEPGSQEKPRLPIDRRRLLRMLVAWRMSRMADPKSVAQAVEALQHRVGGSLYDLGQRVKIASASLYLASSGARGLSGRYLTRLAELADQLMEWKVAAFLRSHAMVAGLNVTRRGGHR